MPRRLLFVSLLLAVLMIPCLPAVDSVAEGLADDGRAAVVLAVQGTALVQPGGHARWSPIGQRSVLFPGDVIRTDARGAHALEVQLAKGGKLLLGPGTVLELPNEGGVRLLRGELEAAGTKAAAVPVSGPGNWKRDVKGTAWLRTAERKTIALDAEPKWITGYRASAGDEWMGSLLAKVDGRDVPLAVGFHKVDVEIRDQIARTTVTQSFVNTTGSILEGVFYFPLPADASISGFGMWIGDELVEADIVEKERARQIYEDILRRKKDPGLLEWEGGNLFKARIYPIPRYGEKRVRIRYTQVLPLEGDTYRYRYALRSELLRSKPLRQLDLDVRVVSAQPLKSVSSPTHEVRVQKSKATAVVSYTAQQVSPKRDFEIAVTVDRPPAIRLLPHRRGEDGYLLLQLAAPDGASGGWKRDLLPEGKPLDLLFVADTSGSMHEAARRNQADFLRSLLGLLGPKDTFRLAAFDQATSWITPERLPADAASIDGAVAALAARRSLGWSDLDSAFDEILKRSDAGTTVVYLGDGIGTTGDADPNALADRLRQRGATAEATVHAVSPASTYETPVLEALASIGGGSVREVGSAPLRSAYALLSEITRPAIKDLRVQVEGLRTARLYPETLPNLPAGRQQIVLGRFLPSDKPQTGRVTMTGTLEGKPVRYHTDVEIPPADVGNAFLPRLWARSHLDALLAKGRTKAVREEIVEFSERFGIMTPYTSFLVLESDEDREKYGVARRVKMRDGERFFAEAADKAGLEARRDAMKRAGTWRLGLRRTMLREIARLARHLPVPYAPNPIPEPSSSPGAASGPIGIGGGGGGAWGAKPGKRGGRGNADGGARDEVEKSEGFALEELRSQSASRRASAPSMREPTDPTPPPPAAMPADAPAGSDKSNSVEDFAETDNDLPFEESFGDSESAKDARFGQPFAKRPAGPALSPAMRRSSSGSRLNAFQDRSGLHRRGWSSGHVPSHRYIGDLASHLVYRVRRQPVPLSLGSLGWPGLPGTPPELKQDAPDWDPALTKHVMSIWRRPQVLAGEGAFHFTFAATSHHPIRGHVIHSNGSELWAASDAWYATSRGLGAQPHEAWVHGGKRGTLAAAFRLARTRKAETADQTDWGFPYHALGRYNPTVAWRTGTARLVKQDGDVVTIAIRFPGVHDNETQLDIDTKRGLLVERRQRAGERVTQRMRWTDPVQVGGVWWPTRHETTNADGKVTRRWTLQVETLERPAFETVVKGRLAAQADAISIHGPLPTVEAAKQARHDREARFVDEAVLTLHFGATQQWKEMWTHWDDARKHVADKPGERYARARLLQRSRRGEAFKTFLGTLADQVAGVANADQAAYLAPYLHGLSSGVLGWNEQRALLERFQAPWIQSGAPDSRLRRRAWIQRMSRTLDGAKDAEAARALRQTYAKDYPFEVEAQLWHEADLWNTGHRARALDQLEEVLTRREPWLDAERERLYVRWTDRLWAARDLDRLQAALTAWLSHRPENATAYLRFDSLLYLRGRVKEGDEVVAAAIAKVLPGDAENADWRRQEAAVRLALGQGWHFRLRRVERLWWAPLRDMVLGYARADLKRHTPAQHVMGNWRFRQSEAYQEVLKALRTDLDAGRALATFSLQRIGLYLGWLPWSRNQVDPELWRQVADAIKARYEAATEKNDRDVLARYVLQVLDEHGEKDEALAFLRARLAAAPDKEKHKHAWSVWSRVTQREFSAARESELFQLLPLLVDPSITDEQKRAAYARSVRQLAEVLSGWYRADTMGPPADRKDLTRAQLKDLQKRARESSRERVAARFKAAALDAPEAARPWLQIERLGYAVQHGANLPSVIAEAKGLLSRRWATDGNPLDRILRERAAAVLAYAATRRNVTDAQIADILALFAAGEKAQAAWLKEHPKAFPLLDWRYQTFRLLVALDRVKRLEGALAAWIVPGKIEARWRLALGYIQAETGRLPEAARQFEAVESANELGAAEYGTLASWYLVLDQDDAYRRAQDGVYRKTGEYQLANLLSRHQYAARNGSGGAPSRLDPEALRLMRILMRKSQNPSRHIWRIRNLYRARKDHRLLESMVDGLTGHTKEAIYNFLQSFGQITSQIHEEATCDAIVARIQALQKEELSVLDRRALDLLMALVEQRASEVPETDPVHETRALASLRAAQQGTWQKGERRLMANFLSGVRFPRGGPFAKEQLRQLRALLDDTPTTDAHRVLIGYAFAEALWRYRQQDVAIAVLRESIDAERKRTGDRLTSNADNAFNRLVDRLVSVRRFRDAETLMLDEMRRQDLPSRIHWIENKLYHTYGTAIYHGGATSLGRGKALFEAAGKAVLARIAEDVTRADPLLGYYGTYHVSARKSGAIPDPGARLRRYVKTEAPKIYARLPLRAHNLVGTMANSLRWARSHNAGIEAILDHHDRESVFIRRIGYDMWRHQHYQLARWRYESQAPLGPLEPRLWSMVEMGLEKKLVHGEHTGSQFWQTGNKWFWGAKRADFGTVAARVFELNESKHAIVQRVANFQYSLGFRAEAISSMQRALVHAPKNVSIRWRLVNWLHDASRDAEALPLIKGLVADHPAHLRYWRKQIDVEARVAGRTAIAATLAAAEAWFRENDRYRESVAAGLGYEAVEHDFAETGVRLFQEAIELRIAARNYRGGRDYTLAEYYRILGEGLGGLGRIDEAVQAVSAAFVAGSRHAGQRDNTNRTLDKILRRSKDLGAWSRAYEAQVEKTGLDATVIRKGLARAFTKRGRHKLALQHLLAAREVDPRDAAIHTALVQTYDALDDPAGAIDALFGSIRLAPHNVEAYAKLADRYAKRGEKAQAERALTTLVETTPHDVAGHKRLAEIREEAGRLEEAAVQWAQVIRTRRLEPTGYLRLAKVLIQLGRGDEARRHIDHLLKESWEGRFGDVRKDAAELLRQLGG